SRASRSPFARHRAGERGTERAALFSCARFAARGRPILPPRLPARKPCPAEAQAMPESTRREMAAEFLGTFVLIGFGTAVVAQVAPGGGRHGGYPSINVAWGLAGVMGIYACAGVSGAHLNPAVTLALAVHRGFPWAKVVPYSVAQVAGAFTASAVTFLTYREAFDRFDGGLRHVVGAKATAGIFATYPQDFPSLTGGRVGPR